MATANWIISYTIVAGADLSAAQYKAVNISGVLATSATNGIGILQNKPQANEHATITIVGVTKALGAAALTAGSFVGYSGTTSGFLATVTSGGIACGRVLVACTSGYPASVYMFGAPTYIAL